MTLDGLSHLIERLAAGKLHARNVDLLSVVCHSGGRLIGPLLQGKKTGFVEHRHTRELDVGL